MSKPRLILLCACLFALAGCHLIYKQNIQQGNALEQDDLDQLEIGMTRNQVAFLLGTPAIQDPFHQDRWDYVSTFSRRGGDPVRRLVTLTFQDDRLATMTGVRADESEVVLTKEGAVAAEAATDVGGVKVEDARDYQDLSLVPENKGWSLQAGSFSTRTDADARMKLLKRYAVDATLYAQVIDDRGFFIIRIGSFDSRDQAEAEMARVEKLTGLRLYLVTPGD